MVQNWQLWLNFMQNAKLPCDFVTKADFPKHAGGDNC